MNFDTQYRKSNVFCGIDISKFPLIGEGREGKVYMLPEGKVIKVYNMQTSCQNQLFILQRAAGCSLFPKVYAYDDNSIIMEFIEGITLKKYLKSNKINKKISLELVKMINEFKALGFTRLDIRTPHIFVQRDESLRVIDTRASFQEVQPIPILMLRELNRLGAIDDFFGFIKDDYPQIMLDWKSAWDKYHLERQANKG